MISFVGDSWGGRVTGLVLKVDPKPDLRTWITVLMLPEKGKVVFEFLLTDIVSAIRGSENIP